MTKRYLESFVTFTRNGVCGTDLVFFRRGDFEVSYLKFWEWSLGRKVHFFQHSWDNQISTILKLSLYIHVVLLINFPEQFE